MSVALGEPVDVMASGLAGLREMLPSLNDGGIVQALRDIETHLRQVQSVMLEVVAQVESRRLAAREGFGTTAGCWRACCSSPRGRPASESSTPPWWAPGTR